MNGLVGSAANERKRAVKLIGEALRVVRPGSKVIRRDPGEAFATKRTRGSTMVNRWRREAEGPPPIEQPTAWMASPPPPLDATYSHAFLLALCPDKGSKLKIETRGPNKGST